MISPFKQDMTSCFQDLKEGEAPNNWCGGSSPTASSSGISVGGSMASSLEDIPQPTSVGWGSLASLLSKSPSGAISFLGDQLYPLASSCISPLDLQDTLVLPVESSFSLFRSADLIVDASTGHSANLSQGTLLTFVPLQSEPRA